MYQTKERKENLLLLTLSLLLPLVGASPIHPFVSQVSVAIETNH